MISRVIDVVAAATIYLYPHFFVSYGMFIAVTDVGAERKTKIHHFVDTNWLGIFYLQADYSGENKTPQYFSNKIEVFNFISLFAKYQRTVFPDLFLGYAYLDPDPLNEVRHEKTEQTVFMDFFYNYYKAYTLKGRFEVYLSQKSSLLKTYWIKEMSLEAGINHNLISLFSGKSPKEYYQSKSSAIFFYYLVFGVSRFTEERLVEFGSPRPDVWGIKTGIRAYFFKVANLELFYQRNYSRSLRNLSESYDYDQYTILFSMYL